MNRACLHLILICGLLFRAAGWVCAQADESCRAIVFMAKETDGPEGFSNSEALSFFSGVPGSGSGGLSTSVTIDDVTYTATGRKGNATLNISFSVQAGKIGTLYVAGNGNSGRSLTLSGVTEGVTTELETLSFVSQPSSVVFATSLGEGSYKLTSNNNVGLAILAIRLCNASTCLAPAIQSATVDMPTIEAGTTATLSATATKREPGSGTLSYQWYLADHTVAGPAGASLSVTPMQTTSYYCKVTDSDCSNVAKSDLVTVTVQSVDVPVIPPGEEVDEVLVFCQGESYMGHTESGVYTIGDKKVRLVFLAYPTMTVCDTRHILSGGTTSLAVYGANYYVWSPAAGLSDIHSASPFASPTVTTTYTVRGYSTSPVNLVKNGDFESGNAGFATDLTTGRSQTGDGRFGKYIITNNPNSHTSSSDYWGGWGSCPDHTRGDGNGRYMVIDGTTVPDKIIWQDTVAVVPHTIYTFSAWFASLKGDNSTLDRCAKLQFFINGSPIGDIRYAPMKKDRWEEYHDTWDSGEATRAIITIKNQNLGQDGNDFGLDDIGLYGLSPCASEQQVQVVVDDVCRRTVTIRCNTDRGTVSQQKK